MEKESSLEQLQNSLVQRPPANHLDKFEAIKRTTKRVEAKFVSSCRFFRDIWLNASTKSTYSIQMPEKNMILKF